MPLADKSKVKIPDPSVLSPVTFLPTIKEALDKSISETFLLVNSAYNPLFSCTFIFGTPKENVVLNFVVFKDPLHIPVILGTAERVTLNPSADTVSIRLNLSTVSPDGVYLI